MVVDVYSAVFKWEQICGRKWIALLEFLRRCIYSPFGEKIALDIQLLLEGEFIPTKMVVHMCRRMSIVDVYTFQLVVKRSEASENIGTFRGRSDANQFA